MLKPLPSLPVLSLLLLISAGVTAAGTSTLIAFGISAPTTRAGARSTPDDWPQWRGAKGTGIADGILPTTWSSTEGVTWRTELRGLGVSSPIVSGDRVLVTYQIGRGVRRQGSHPTLVRDPQTDSSLERPLGNNATGTTDADISFAVAAFDRSDGRLLWEHQVAAKGTLSPVHDKHNLASPSPVTDGELIYAWFGTGQLLAIDMDGQLVWQRHIGEEYSPFDVQWGHASSPTLYGESLILQCDHGPAAYLLWLDKRSGEERLRIDRGAGMNSHSTPTVVPGPGGDELIVNSSERLESYDPQTGEILWYAGGSNSYPIGVATHDAGILYTSRGYRSGPYMAIRLGGRGDVTQTHVLWRVPTGAPYISSILLYDGLIYMGNGNGIVTAVDPKNGERVWQQRMNGIFSASPVAGDGKIYFVSETGETIVLQAGPTLRVLARNPLDERVIASPAVSGGRIFLRTDEHLVAIGG